MTKLYIAYGSNLCKTAMRRRCPDARPRGKFTLSKAQLVFRGCADLDYHPTAKVPCGLWEISKADERVLDMYEGVGSGLYFKSEEIVLKYEGERRPALIYLMRSEGVYPPSQGYVNVIRQGYRDFKLDQSYLDEAITRSYLKKNPDEQTTSRRERERKSTDRRALVEMPEAVALKRLELKRAMVAPEVEA